MMSDNRRVHREVDKLPKELVSAIQSMFIDNEWPEDHQGKRPGSPHHQDMADYVQQKGYKISVYSIGRYCRHLGELESMKHSSLTLVTQGCRFHAEADSLEALRPIISEQIWSMIHPQKEMRKLSLDDAAKETLRVYQSCRRRRTHSKIIEAGSGLEVCRCYLQDMTIRQTMDQVNNNGVKLSHSAIGRFFIALRKLGISSVTYGSRFEGIECNVRQS